MTSALANIGDGATIYIGSDRTAATVVKVTPKTVTLQRDNSTPAADFDFYANQSYDFTPNPEAGESVFSLRQDGKLYMRGTEMGRNGIRCSIGTRDQYRDPSF